MAKRLLEARNLKKYFNTKDGVVKAVDGVDFTLGYKETLGLVGESGSGKSTVAYTVVGIYAPTDGELQFLDTVITSQQKKRMLEMRRNIQIVFQDPGTSLNPRKSIRQILGMPLMVHRIVSKAKLDQEILRLLELVDLPATYIYKYPTELGEGEKQAIALARAMAVRPALIVLDEPTSALDVSVQAKIINLLTNLQEEFNISYLFITHDLSLMRNVATKIAIMYLGRVCELATAAEFFQNPLHPYTRMLISSVPVVSEEEETLKPKKFIPRGEIPSPVNLPPGCGFNPRCPDKMDICAKERPLVTELEDGRIVFCHKYRK